MLKHVNRRAGDGHSYRRARHRAPSTIPRCRTRFWRRRQRNSDGAESGTSLKCELVDLERANLPLESLTRDAELGCRTSRTGDPSF
jgi:hypothetical protein